MNAPRPSQQQRPRIARRALHGVLLLDKPLGLSSNDALQKVKRLFRAEKAGHTGTLDPLATGLLPLCFGAATKFSQLSLDADKGYRAVLKLGVRTSTGDAEGEVLATRPVAFDAAQLEAARAALLGEIEQVPPMHSALKHQGRALYDYARDGIEIERAPRRVRIHRLDILRWQADEMEIDVLCSKGTYIRTLAEDLGERLGCGAHLTALRRTQSGALGVPQAHTLESLQQMGESERDAQLLAPDVLLAGEPEVRLNEAEAGRFLTGLRRRINLPDTPLVRVFGPQPRAFLGSAHVCAGELIPNRLLSPPEVEALLA
ncbi:MAG: tRNA pseudouridine(55) synthase TruB [Aquabacterium sp.]|jgi:tRNA pseudouridine55 synthase|nr:MAG: tRNA pseudouridine(55) synthase TruB [Aquabacterium sp.]